VVGRPIWKAADPVAAAKAIIAEMASPQAQQPNR
jgi:orotidine-5'-phosphate decarboxylase